MYNYVVKGLIMDDFIIVRILSTYICDLKIDLRTYNILSINKLYTLRDIVKLRKIELKKLKNMNGSALNQIMHIVYSSGLCFKDDYPTYNQELLNVFDEGVSGELKRIEELNFSLKIVLALRKKGIYNVGDLVNLSFNDLTKINNLNKHDIALINLTIKNLGLCFKEEGVKMHR